MTRWASTLRKSQPMTILPNYESALSVALGIFSLKNCDNKVPAGAENYIMTPMIAKHAASQEEGFVKGRQGLNNVITVDCHTRVIDARSVAFSNLSIDLTAADLVYCDAVFPSLAHAFIFVALRWYEVAYGTLLFFAALYANNVCFVIFGGAKWFMYKIMSGILQGCQPSGSLFVLAVYPFLRMRKSQTEKSRFKAFADDLAAMIGQFRQLSSLSSGL